MSWPPMGPTDAGGLCACFGTPAMGPNDADPAPGASSIAARFAGATVAWTGGKNCLTYENRLHPIFARPGADGISARDVSVGDRRVEPALASGRCARRRLVDCVFTVRGAFSRAGSRTVSGNTNPLRCFKRHHRTGLRRPANPRLTFAPAFRKQRVRSRGGRGTDAFQRGTSNPDSKIGHSRFCPRRNRMPPKAFSAQMV